MYNRDILTSPKFFYNAPLTTSLINSSATFYRNESNSNIEIYIPIGSLNISEYVSPNVYFPINIFNNTAPNSTISYPNNRDIQILKNYTCLYDISIHFKLANEIGNNYINQREIYATLVKEDGITEYSPLLTSVRQPDTSQHDILTIKGYFPHLEGDIVRIKLNVIQDLRFSGESDTTITIFYISINIL